MKLKRLQEWIEDILATPAIELDVRYSWFDNQPHREASDDIKALPFYIRERPYMHRVASETLHQLHQKVRGHGCESNLWDSIFWEIYEVTLQDGEDGLPASILHDFIDRDMSGLLGHLSYSPPLEGVLRRLAALGPDRGRAAVSLAEEYFTNPQRTTEEFATVMEQYYPDTEIMETLWHSGTSSREKLAIYDAYAARYAESKWWRYGNLRDRPSPEPEESLDVRFFNKYVPAPKSQWKYFYGTDTPEELVALARDPNTPDEILKELVEISEAPFSRRISRNAEQNLAARYPQEETSE